MKRPLQEAIVTAFAAAGAEAHSFAVAWQAEIAPLDTQAKPVAVSVRKPAAPVSESTNGTAPTLPVKPKYDLFISHASEDKDSIARPLCDAPQDRRRTRPLPLWRSHSKPELFCERMAAARVRRTCLARDGFGPQGDSARLARSQSPTGRSDQEVGGSSPPSCTKQTTEK
jgi:hypothetical protein